MLKERHRGHEVGVVCVCVCVSAVGSKAMLIGTEDRGQKERVRWEEE